MAVRQKSLYKVMNIHESAMETCYVLLNKKKQSLPFSHKESLKDCKIRGKTHTVQG